MINRETLRLESQFVLLIKDFKQQVDEIEKASKECKNAVIFIGDTGSGKSTLVNWLNGAEFQVKENKSRDAYLKMKAYQTQKYSKIGTGNQSVTLYPEYYHNQIKKILTIDFPGFKDTRGWQEQLIIKMMYMDVVKRFDTKFVIVVQQATTTMQYREQFLIELVNTTFQPQDGSKLDSICFIQNQFTQGEKKFEQLKDILTFNLDDMKENTSNYRAKGLYEALKNNIQIVEKIYSEEDYQRIFSDQNRQKLWQAINSTKPIQIQCKKLEYSGDIGEYLQIMSDKYLQEILDFLNNTWSCHVIATYDIQILKLMIDELNKMINGKADLKYFQEIPNFLAKLCRISNTNNSQKTPQNIEEYFITFFELLEFFERYKEFIQGYKSYEDYIQIIKKDFSSKKYSFQSQLEQKVKHEQQENDNRLKKKKLLDQRIIEEEKQTEICRKKMEKNSRQLKETQQVIIQKLMLLSLQRTRYIFK